VSHGRYVAFQMAEVATPRNVSADILQLIAELRPPSDPAPALSYVTVNSRKDCVQMTGKYRAAPSAAVQTPTTRQKSADETNVRWS
jgi:hypothetical protein